RHVRTGCSQSSRRHARSRARPPEPGVPDGPTRRRLRPRLASPPRGLVSRRAVGSDVIVVLLGRRAVVVGLVDLAHLDVDVSAKSKGTDRALAARGRLRIALGREVGEDPARSVLLSRPAHVDPEIGALTNVDVNEAADRIDADTDEAEL